MNQLATITLDEEYQALSNDCTSLDVGVSRLLCERSLYEFVQQAWDIVEPGHEFKDNWHIRKLCADLEALFWRKKPYSKRDGRAIYNVPPGMSKSLIVMVFFPAWAWAKNPRLRFMCASYGAHLSTRDNLRCRQLIESPWYQDRWQVKLLDDQNTKTRYNTTAAGWRISTSVGGPGTGEHPDYILIDDPHSAMQARSDTERQAALDWFDNTVSTRLGRNPAFVLIMQRLHKSDLTGHLLAKGGWRHVRWPMKFEKCTCLETAPVCNPDEASRCPLHKDDPKWVADELDERTQIGELLHPSFKDAATVKQMELDLGPIDAPGQLQQRPVAEGGGLFRRGWFKFVDAVPTGSLFRRCRGWDTAATEKGGDHTVGVRMSDEWVWVDTPKTDTEPATRILKPTGRIFVEDVVRDQLSPAGVDALMQSTAKLDGRSVAIREEREGGSSGKTVTQARATTFGGYDYEEVRLGSDKVTRSKPFRAQVEAGNVYLVRASWNEAYLSELAAFNAGDEDDQVDASGCAYNSIVLMPKPVKMKLTVVR